MKLAAMLAVLLLPGIAGAEQRYAIVIGNDIGSIHRPRLWFAQHDAATMADVLVELGNFPRDHVNLLQASGAREVRQAFASTDKAIASARAHGDTALLIVYYSGHADRKGLELGTEALSYDELRKLVARSPADARVAIVDACESGEITHVKGARAVETLDFPLHPQDHVKGVAYLASTAEGESAQESAALGGSFFTTHLETALRGAADFDNDGRVTLLEAFQYTRARTIASTTLTQIGTQHPTYNISLSGRGDVVLTDRRRGEATLVLPAGVGATYVVLSQDGFVSEVAGGEAEAFLSLPAGRYTVERHARSDVTSADVTLEKGANVPLPETTPVAPQQGTLKGGALIVPCRPANLLDGQLGRQHLLGPTELKLSL